MQLRKSRSKGVVCPLCLLLDFERSREGNELQEPRFSYLLSRRRVQKRWEWQALAIRDASASASMALPIGDLLVAAEANADNCRVPVEASRLLLFVYMGTSAHKEYQAFVDKVERTVYLDNLSPHVTISVLKTALGQFGNVVNAQFIPNYMDAGKLPQCALVEMETAKQAKSVVTEMTMYPFMMSGMPRPVRARPAEPEMFSDRPARPGRKITCRWMDSKDPDVEIAKKLKYLTKKHCAESSFLLKHQLEEEQKLAKQQDEFLKSNYKKYDMLDSVRADGTVRRVARHYDVVIRDD